MDVGYSPLVRRTRLGAELRQLREQGKYTVKALAEELGWSHSRLSRLENAKTRPEVGMVMDILDALGVTGPEAERLTILAREAARPGWWKSVNDIGQRTYAELESGAVAIRVMSMATIPGLLQTGDYAQLRAAAGRDEDEDRDEVQDRVAARLARQQILGRVELEVILDESVLRRPLCPPGVFTAQLAHLIQLGRTAQVRLRLYPFDRQAEDYFAMIGQFTLFRYAEPRDPDTVTVELHTGLLHIAEDVDVDAYRDAYERVRAATLTPEETLAWLGNLIDAG